VIDESGRVTNGYYIQVMEQAARRAGFHWRVQAALTNATLSHEFDVDDMADWGVTHYDLYLSPLAATPSRKARGFRFGFPLTPGDPVFIVPFHNEGAGLFEVIFSYLRPFKMDVWLAILALFIFTGMLYMWLEPNAEELSGMTPIQAYSQSVFLGVGSFTGGAGYTPYSPAGRLFIIGWTFTILLLTSAYTANLAGLLIVEGKQGAVVKSLSEAVHRGLKVCVPEGTIYEKILRGRQSGVRAVPIQRGHRTQPILDGTCVGMVEGEDAWDIWRGMADANPGCKLDIVGTPMVRLDGSFVAMASTRDQLNQFCTDKLMDLLSGVMLGMYQDDHIKEAYTQTYHRLWDMEECGKHAAHEQDASLGLVQMSGIFCTYFAITAVAACFLPHGRKTSPSVDSEASSDESVHLSSRG